MTDSIKIVREQGGSVLRIDSGGSVNFADGAMLNLGQVQLLFGTDTSVPTVTAVPGSIYFRSDGSVSNIYINRSTGTSGSVWKGGSFPL